VAEAGLAVLLEELTSGVHTAGPRTLPPRLVPRGSVGPPQGGLTEQSGER
jgi:DNA-binding LacI/PurR family transcriptional regulator